MLSFNEASLRHELDQLPVRSRAAFAAGCAQRLIKAFDLFATSTGRTEQSAVIHEAMDFVWGQILSAPESHSIGGMLEKVMDTIPDQDAPGWTPLTAYAEDAASAVAYCLRCLQSGTTQEAVWAAGRTCEALDQFVILRDDVSLNDPDVESRVRSDPLIQRELDRQVRDLTDLNAAGERISQAFLDRFRQRSLAEQAIPLAR